MECMTTTTKLDGCGTRLLALHKTLLDRPARRYEREHAASIRASSSTGAARRLFRMAARGCRAGSRAGRAHRGGHGRRAAELRGVIDKLRTLVRFEGNRVTEPYREIHRGRPDALARARAASRLLAISARPAVLRRSAGGASRRRDAGDADRRPHFAADKHPTKAAQGQGGLPYINHPIMLARYCRFEGGVDDALVLCAAVLHDTIEDTETATGARLACSGARSRRGPRSHRERRYPSRAQATADQHAPRTCRVRPSGELADKIANVARRRRPSGRRNADERRREYFDWRSGGGRPARDARPGSKRRSTPLRAPAR